jgi:hypothetical protein
VEEDFAQEMLNEIARTKFNIEKSKNGFKGPKGHEEKKLMLHVLDSLLVKLRGTRSDDIIFARRKSCECLGCGKCCKKLKKADNVNLNELLYN